MFTDTLSLTVSTKHPILRIMRKGNMCGFQFLHEGVVECGSMYSAAVQNGLTQNKSLCFCLTDLSALPSHSLDKHITHECELHSLLLEFYAAGWLQMCFPSNLLNWG